MTATLRLQRWRRQVLAALGLAAVALVTGCGGSSSSSSGSGGSGSTPQATGAGSTSTSSSASSLVSQAAQAVAQARKPPASFVPPGPTFDASKAKGKTVYVIAAGVNVPFIADVDKGITDGLASAGVATKVFDGQANPALVTQYLGQAVAQKADLIINESIPSSVITAPLAKAKAAGIPVVEMFETGPGPLPKAMADRGITAQATQCAACAGKLMADWAIMHTDGKVNAVGIENSAIASGNLLKQAIIAELAKCSGCSLKWLDTISALQWPTKLPTLTSSALLNPSVDTLFPIYDNMATFMIPVIHSRGAQNRVTIASYNANGEILKDIKNGTVGADMGESAEWLGWGGADQALRVLSGVQPLDSEKVPIRLFDKENIGQIDTSAPQASWFNVNFQDGYKKMWGLH